jgi:hypothetical protein
MALKIGTRKDGPIVHKNQALHVPRQRRAKLREGNKMEFSKFVRRIILTDEVAGRFDRFLLKTPG